MNESKQGWREKFDAIWYVPSGDTTGKNDHKYLHYKACNGEDVSAQIKDFIDQTIQEREEGLRGKIEALRSNLKGPVLDIGSLEYAQRQRDYGRNDAVDDVLALLSDKK